MTLIPAYGRDYKSEKAVLADFDANKNFIITDMFHPSNGKLVNKPQLTGQTVTIRYKKLTRAAVVRV